jgi:hypothetical protein
MHCESLKSSAIREPNSLLLSREIFGVRRDKQAVLAERARPDDGIGKFQPVLSPQSNRFLGYTVR